MSDLRLELDLGPLLDLGKDLQGFESEIHRSVATLSAQTHLHIIEDASKVLHSRREIYIKALHKPSEVSPGVFVITLDESALWIEEKTEQHSMVNDLLGDNPKIAKDGSRYRCIPFSHNKGGPATNTPAEQQLVDAIKTELKKLRIPWAGIERNPDGSPKTGTLHKISIATPSRPAGTAAGPGGNQQGWGRGPEGAPRVGPTGIPLLQGLRISQTGVFNPDGSPKLNKMGQQAARRDIMTFRVVSSKHLGQNRWIYPEKEGVNLMDKAMDWAEREWDQRIVPDLLKKLGG